MKKILYVMHVPWGWIKQRPHFFAEYLADDFYVDVKFRKSNSVRNYNIKNFSPNKNLHISSFRMFPFYKIPFLKYFGLNWINKFLFKLNIGNVDDYDYIWITSPILWDLFDDKKKSNKLIYDCMDDALEFPSVKSDMFTYNYIYNSEKKVILNSYRIIFSANHLANVIMKRYDFTVSPVIINNAIFLYKSLSDKNNLESDIVNKIKSLKNPFVYIGTISEWFDFESIINLLNCNSNVNVVLIGPIQEVSIPNHSRLYILGPVKHEEIYTIMGISKVLIMPFKINELINSVNPVKMYEYIYSGKPIIASYYEETLKFEEYAFLYKNSNEFIQISEFILNGNAKSDAQTMRKFSENNTWRNRYLQIKELL